ncbi:MAG: chromosomal replication initiator protein DnaA [Actinobacteria bacterium]|nr:chromosomal replication initiator protein DnaA [Actinomycetota bacterium]
MVQKTDLLWEKYMVKLQDQVPDSSSMWFKNIYFDKVDGSTLVIYTNNTFTKEWVDKRYIGLLRRVASEVFPGVEEVKIILKDRRKKPGRDPVYLDVNILAEEEGSEEGGDLNPRFTFETFVIGSSNRFAHAAALSVSENPTCYNPLYIYGGVGLGKTHLLHSIGHYTKKLYPGFKVIYRSSEQFLNDFINALSSGRTSSFQRKYRSIDMLLIDDVQFLANKEKTLEEFFHTFNELYNNNKQIVLSSDRPPEDIAGLQDRLISRFKWGLTTDIQPPELETRIAILRKKSSLDKKEVPDEVIDFIASKFVSNIRELEGALIRVVAYSNLTKEPLSLELAKEVLRDILPAEEQRTITIDHIMKTTADYFNLSVSQLTSPNRSRQLVIARQICMYLCRELTDASLPVISDAFGGRHHSTTIHSVEKIKKLMEEKRDIYDAVQKLTNLVKQG